MIKNLSYEEEQEVLKKILENIKESKVLESKVLESKDLESKVLELNKLRTILFFGYQNYVYKLARKYSKGVDFQELLSQNYELLWKTIVTLKPDFKITGFKAYLNKIIWNRFLTFLQNKPIVRNMHHDAWKKPRKDRPIVSEDKITNDLDLSFFEFFDLIEDITTDLEKKIIKLRLQGYSDPEIGKKLNLTKVKVFHIRHGIQRKINDKSTRNTTRS